MQMGDTFFMHSVTAEKEDRYYPSVFSEYYLANMGQQEENRIMENT